MRNWFRRFKNVWRIFRNYNKRENRKVVWKCKCVCGKEVEVVSTNLTSGRTKSCGCKKNEMISAAIRHIEKEVHAGDIVNNTLILDLYFNIRSLYE